MLVGKRLSTIIFTFLATLFILLMSRDFRQRQKFPFPHGSERQEVACAEQLSNSTSADNSIPSLLDAPSDYRTVPQQPLWCEQRLGLTYLESLCYSEAEYCTSESQSQLTCFHSQTSQDGRTDSFCLGRRATLDRASSTFQVSCQLTEPKAIYSNGPTIALQEFPRYWYETGPRTVFDSFVDLTSEATKAIDFVPPVDHTSFTILLKREGAGNLWHCLMEIMSLSWTLDVLQMSPDPSSQENRRPFLTPDDASNTQVVILDDAPDGPYFELWNLFAQRPTLRLADLAGTDVGNIIIPLPGGSNPVWQGDWEPNTCDHSELLETFSRRVLAHLNISDHDKHLGDPPQRNRDITVAFIERRGTRKLVDMDQHIAALRSIYTHTEIRVLNMESLPLTEQIQNVRDCDVLIGVHGAGLTHAMWLKKRSVVVEILPEGFQHKGFRNLAGVLGHGYFSAHGARAPGSEDDDWQMGDVSIDREALRELMDVAIKSIYNRGVHNFDVNRGL